MQEIIDIYPSKLFNIANLELTNENLKKSCDFFRYLGMNLSEVLGLMYIEIIFRNLDYNHISKILNTPWNGFFSQKNKIKKNPLNDNETKKAECRDYLNKFIKFLENNLSIMSKNNNEVFLEMIYNNYFCFLKEEELKTGCVLFIKNLGYQNLKKKGLSEKEVNKFDFIDLFSNNFYEKDLLFLAETLGIHIQIYHLSHKNEVSNFSYKEKYYVKKPYPLKILQKEGKFYGLYLNDQNVDLDNMIFDETTKFDEILLNPSNMTIIPRNVEKFSYEEKKESKGNNDANANKREASSKSEKNNNNSKDKFKCSLCHEEIISSTFFNNPSCNHIYCFKCVIDRYEKKQFFNLCFERICTKPLSLNKLEKFLLEMSMMQAKENFEEIGVFPMEQECFHCKKTDQIFLESFSQYEYYKCFHCQKLSCIIHKNIIEKCFCICPKCFEQTNYIDGYVKKKCLNCKEAYCLICSKNMLMCKCFCKKCSQIFENQNEPCQSCSYNCKICGLQYKNKNCLKQYQDSSFVCRYCIFNKENFSKK